jgi:hypothetical protein
MTKSEFNQAIFKVCFDSDLTFPEALYQLKTCVAALEKVALDQCFAVLPEMEDKE